MTLQKTLSLRPALCALALWVMFVAVTPRATAGGIASCREPFAFHGAEINVVVLPYFQAGPSPRPLNGLGSQLALLVKLETLYRALAYDHWGIVLLMGNKDECDPDKIAARLLQQIDRAGRLVVVSGKLYQQDEDIYVQTFARFYRKPMPDEKTVPAEVGFQLGGKTFQGRITGQQFAFPPEQLPIKVMDAIAANFTKAAFIYDSPHLDSHKRPLPLDSFRRCDFCENGMAFTVEGRMGDWIRIKKNTEEPGYLLAHLEEGMSLSQQMPEVGFLQGLMGFLRYNQPGVQTANAPAGMQVARQALLEYAKRSQAAEEPETLASALQLSAILEFNGRHGASSEQFDAAYQLVPYDADARNLAAMFRLHRDYSAPGKNLSARDTANDFIAAVALQPKNSLVLDNLESFYELLGTPAAREKIRPGTAIEPDEIEAQLAKLRAILPKLGDRPAPPGE